MRRVPLALLLLAASGFGPAAVARADLVYVLNSGDASISVLDSTTHEEARRIPVLREAHHLLLTPDRSRLVVGDSGANELLFIDPATAEVTRRDRFSNPYHMEYTPDGKLLVVTSLRRDQVDIYDAPTLSLLARLKVPDKPSHLAFSPDSRLAYVTLQGVRRVMAIDLAERKPVWTAEVGPQPAGITWHRGRLLVGIMGSDHVAVVNPADGKVERTIFVGRGAHTVFPAPDGRALYATSRVDSRISVLDPETLAVTARFEVAGGPDCIAFDPADRLWVTLRWIGRVAVLDPRSGEVETIPVGRSPHGIFVQPRQGALPALLQAAVASTPPPSGPGTPAVAPVPSGEAHLALPVAASQAVAGPPASAGQAPTGSASFGLPPVPERLAVPIGTLPTAPAASGQVLAASPAGPAGAPAPDGRPYWRRLLGR